MIKARANRKMWLADGLIKKRKGKNVLRGGKSHIQVYSILYAISMFHIGDRCKVSYHAVADRLHSDRQQYLMISLYSSSSFRICVIPVIRRAFAARKVFLPFSSNYH